MRLWLEAPSSMAAINNPSSVATVSSLSPFTLTHFCPCKLLPNTSSSSLQYPSDKLPTRSGLSSISSPSFSTSLVHPCSSKSKTHLVLPFSAASSAQFLSSSQCSLYKLPHDQLVKPQFRNIDHHNLLNFAVRCRDVELAVAVHALILKLEEDTRLSNAVIVAYLKLGRLDYAQKVFETLSYPDVVSYTAMIFAFAKSNREHEAVDLFFRMRKSGIEPNHYGFVAILSASIRLLELQLGFQVHAMVTKLGYLNHVYVANALMGLYGSCGFVDFIFEVFDKMPHRDIASWNTVISVEVKELMYERAFELFRDMLQIDGFTVDHITLSTLFAASTEYYTKRRGQELHAHALRIGFESNLSVNNALLRFYRKYGGVNPVVSLFEKTPIKDVITWTELIVTYMESGLIDMAMEVFERMPEKNCISYNALLAGFYQNGEGSRALRLFCRMVEDSMELSDFTLTSVVSACGLLRETEISKQIHGFVLKFGFGSNYCIETALLHMCTKCGRMDDAEKMFNKWPSTERSSILWTAMICGYAQNGQPDKAISLFCLRQWKETIVDEVALAAGLGICGTLGVHVLGEQLHGHALKSGLFCDTGVGNSIVSMYSKCGKLKDAVKVFYMMATHDIVSWNGLMAALILHREGDKALVVWEKMEKAAVQPDSVACLLKISAYKYTSSNLVDHCQSFFVYMKAMYHIEPTSEHYASMVRVLGFWGFLEEAEEMINKMPSEPGASVWRALLNSCRIHRNTDIGKRAAKKILALEPQDTSTYVLKSNLYSASGRWSCSEMVRKEMREKGLQKFPGRSWFIHQNKVHFFHLRDKLHSQSKDIYSGLEILILECLKAGYVPDTSFVLHEVEENQKKDFLFYHSAKLAATYGLLMTKPVKPICIMKNVLLCGDCHTFFKYVSIVTKREIHVRDASGFHCFSHGKCSCKDRW